MASQPTALNLGKAKKPIELNDDIWFLVSKKVCREPFTFGIFYKVHIIYVSD